METPSQPESAPPPLKRVLEALLFSAQSPLSSRELREYLVQAAQDECAPEAAAYRKVKEDEIRAALGELEGDYADGRHSFRLMCVAGSWQFASLPEYGAWLRALVGRKPRPPRLSAPALETLTIVAYRQPTTRAEIEQIRGVSVDGVMQTLLERGLIEAVGRAEVVGRPITYGTTLAFLEYFGIESLDQLPAGEELRRLPVTRPESLLTAEPGLATVPEEGLKPSSAPDPAPVGEPAVGATISGAEAAATSGDSGAGGQEGTSDPGLTEPPGTGS
ncbi:MAG: SMC-Scp complex subunit ScpB [Verrucomicrobiae bacterium]|nr:SMC-Scp complex subunit ScpB [Verrucomicrobiae bacterium]